MIKRIAPKVVAIALVAITALNFIQPVATNAALSSQLGTSAALGSPLINENFSVDDYQKWEMTCFGVFISNFAVPLVDDYKSAFATGQGGSEGRGREALQFADGNDASANEALQAMLDYAINAQKPMKPITVQYTCWNPYNGQDGFGLEYSSKFPDTPESAEAKDLFIQYMNWTSASALDTEGSEEVITVENGAITAINQPYLNADVADSAGITVGIPIEDSGSGGAQAKAQDISSAINSNIANDTVTYYRNLVSLHEECLPLAILADAATAIDQPVFAAALGLTTAYEGALWLVGTTMDLIFSTGSIRLARINTFYLPTFYVKSNDGTTDIKIFDLNDSWDLQTWALWSTDADLSEFSDKAYENLKTMCEQHSKLYLDTFGNIVAEVSGRYIILVPAAANQHLTTTPTINMLNSVVLNGRYTSQSLSGLQVNVTSKGYSDADQAFGLTVSGDSTLIEGGQTGEFYLAFDTDTYLYNLWMDAEDYLMQNSGGDINDYYEEHFSMAKAFSELASSTLNRSSSGYSLKANINGYATNDTMNWLIAGWKTSPGLESMATYASIAAQILGNVLTQDPTAKVIDYMHTNVSEQDPIFGDPGYIVVSEQVGKGNSWSDSLVNSVLKYVDGSDTDVYTGVVGMPTPSEMRSYLDGTRAPTLLKLDNNQGNNSLTTGTLTGLYSDSQLISWLLCGSVTDSIADLQYTTNNSSIRVGAVMQNAMLKQNILQLKVSSAAELSTKTVTQMAEYLNDAVALDGGYGLSVNMFGVTFGDGGTIDWGGNGQKRMKNAVQRVQKVYTRNQNMVCAENVLSLQDGTQFAAWTPWIYITYLEVYGIDGDNSNFNDQIWSAGLDLLNIDGSDLLDGVYLSDEDKQKSINDYTYLMLHPTAGRDYRANILLDWISDLVYNSYVSIVYGSNAYDYAGGLGSSSGSGFLKFNNYEDNFFTGWFIQGYIQYAVVIVGVGAVAILLVALIMKKRLAWILLSLLMLVNVVLLMPSIGDLTPTLASNMVQEMFKSHMTYWCISESIANQQLEETYISSMNNGATGLDAGTVYVYIKQLNTVTLDRTLMIKQDISKKIIENSTGIMNIVQQNASTRWLLPRLMSQFTGDNQTLDYVYTTLGDMFDNWSSMYWVYEPDDRNNAKTINASSQAAGEEATKLTSTQKKTAYWADYLGTSAEEMLSSTNSDGLYNTSNASKSGYTGSMFVGTAATSIGNIKCLNPDSATIIGWASPYLKSGSSWETWHSISRESIEADSDSSLAHTQFYMIPGLSVPVKKNLHNSDVEESWETYAEYFNMDDPTYLDTSGNPAVPGVTASSDRSLTSVQQDFQTALTRLENEASNYNPREVGAQDEFGFLWATENPGSYFYQVVKDSFAVDNKTVAELTGGIQGYYVESSLTGLEERVSAMHLANTGEVRDILDLQEMFTNMIPYLASVQYAACGTNGTNGIFGDTKLDNYHVYNDNYASWLFRSNWVTKIVENEVLTKPCTVKYDGVEYYIADPTDPRCYPQERPMVFSDAQKYVYGLSDSELTLVEVKCCQLNTAVERQWTLLLNYVNTSGMTSEVMFRQMALAALLEFDTEFSDTGIQTSATKLYPTSVDLRYLSFDSIMKMLMINSSGNASYIYGDTMKGVINNSDILSAILLLIGAFLSQTVIPLFRDLLMALVFYLGLWSVICNIFAGGKAKLKVCAGFTISNAIYLVMTLLYFAVFGLMLQMSSADEVLSLSSITVDNGPPTWEFIIIIAVSLLYIWGSWKMLKFVIKNYRDLGFEVYATWSNMLAGKITDSVDSLKSSFSNRDSSGSSGGAVGSGASSGGGSSGAAVAGAAVTGVAVGAVAGAAGATVLTQAEQADSDADDVGGIGTQSGYSVEPTGQETSSGGGSGAFDIDSAVQRGREGRQSEEEPVYRNGSDTGGSGHGSSGADAGQGNTGSDAGAGQTDLGE